MRRKLSWNQRIMMILICLSVLFAAIQLILFHDTKESVFLFLQDLIFLPVNILLVTFILDRIIQTREKQEKLDHMNIVIGAFFGEIGNAFLHLLSGNIVEINQIRQMLSMNADWSDRTFDNAAKTVRSFSFTVLMSNEYLQELKNKLPADRMQLTRLFENPNLLEHDSFTDMLWAVYHLIDELENREDVCTLPDSDLKHISGDIVRAYSFLLYEWVYYMKHLKNKYPYLWSLAARNNPLSETAHIIITE